MKKMMAIMVIMLMLSAVSLWADEVEDTINEALEYYKKGDHSTASSTLEYAAQLIGQKRADVLQELLPEPLEGWQAEAAKSEAIAASLLGGGLTAERRYMKSESSVEIKFLADSPMMQSMLMLFSNPTFVAASGGKLERIAGQKAIVEYDPNILQGKVTVMVGANLIVTVEGTAVQREDLLGYANAIDYKKVLSL